MDKKTKNTLLAVYIGWAFLHLIFLFLGMSGNGHDGFWPFSESERFRSNNEGISGTYDFSEFLVYSGSPLVIYFIYKLLNKKED